MLVRAFIVAPGESALRIDGVVMLSVMLLLAGGMAFVAFRPLWERRARGARAASAGRRHSLANPVRQVEAVRSVRFEVTPLLTGEEPGLLRMIEAAVGELDPSCRVLPRISLDEVVRPLSQIGGEWDDAMASIRSKRIDFAVFDAAGRLIAALGWEERARSMGEGRDRVRRTALAQAGIPYVVIDRTMSVDCICRAIASAMEMRRAA